MRGKGRLRNLKPLAMRGASGKGLQTRPSLEILLLGLNACGIPLDAIICSNDVEEQAQLRTIDAQLRASKNVSAETLQALETIIRLARLVPTAAEE